MRDAAAVTKKPTFDFKMYMAERAQVIDAALDRSVPLQYPEIINEAMRYSLLAGGCWPGSAADSAALGADLQLPCPWLVLLCTVQVASRCWLCFSLPTAILVMQPTLAALQPHHAGGKRVRPALCLAACELVGGTIEQVRTWE